MKIPINTVRIIQHQNADSARPTAHCPMSPQATVTDTVCFGQMRKKATGAMAGNTAKAWLEPHPSLIAPLTRSPNYIVLAGKLHAHYFKRIRTLTETFKQSVAGIESTLEKYPNPEALQQLSDSEREQLSVQLRQYGRKIQEQMTEERQKIHEETCFYSAQELEKSISDLKETLANRESERAADRLKEHLKKAEDMHFRLPRAPLWKKLPKSIRNEFSTDEQMTELFAKLKNDFKPLHDHFSEVTGHRWSDFTLKLHLNPIEGIQNFQDILDEKNAVRAVRFFQEASPRLRKICDEIEAQMNVRIFENPEIKDPQVLLQLPENEKGEKRFKHWNYTEKRLM